VGLKAWFALMLPEAWATSEFVPNGALAAGLEFKTFAGVRALAVPDSCGQVGGVVYRLLSWNPYQPIFFDCLMRCGC